MGKAGMANLGNHISHFICVLLLGLVVFSPSPGEAKFGRATGDTGSASLEFLQKLYNQYGLDIDQSLYNNVRIQRRSSSIQDCPEGQDCTPDMTRFMILQGAANSVSRLSRPRFGKRSGGEEDSLSNQYFANRFGKRGDDESFVNLQNPSDDSRMGKRGDVTPSQADFLLLQDADEALSRLNRPRFGKREDGSNRLSEKRFKTFQEANESMSRLSRPRFGKRSLMIPGQPYVYGGPGGGSAPAVLETVKPDVQIPEVTILPDPRSLYGRALQDPMMLRDRQMMLVG